MPVYKVVDNEGNELFPAYALHPGEVLKDELEYRKIKKSDFAAEIGLRPSHFSELLHGKRHVNAALAVKLEQLLDIDAEYWMRVQASYEINLERIKNSKEED